MKASFTNHQIEAMGNGLSGLLGSAKSSAKVAYKFTQALNSIKPHLDSIGAARKAVIEKYGDGNTIPQGEPMVKAVEDLNEVLNASVEIEVPDISEDELFSLEGEVNMSLVHGIMPLFEKPQK